MFGFLSRAIGFILGSFCLSVTPILFFIVTSRRRNGGLLRKFLLASYHLYAGVLNRVEPFILKKIGLDILNLFPRILITCFFSFGIGWGIFSLLKLRLSFWPAVIFVLHGLFIGWQWDLVEFSQDFQMGVRIE